MDVTDLRIAMFTGNYNVVRDGANQALHRLVDFLQHNGAKVRVYSPVVRKPGIPANARIVNVPAIPVPGRAEYRAPIMLPARAMRDIRRYAPNIFHIASPEILGHRAVSFARELDIPVVASVHTRFETYFRYYGLAFLEPVVEAALRRLYRRCDAIFAPSESMAQLLREQRMNYNVGIWSRGIDRDIFDPRRRDCTWRRSIGIADDVPVIGFVGRIVMEKGLDVYSDAINLLERRQIRHRVLVVGEGPARGWFEKRLPSAIFVGHQTGADLGRAVASMDLLFNPSITETFGNVTLEAMAVGLPVVAASATGSLSLVADGVTGRLIRPGAIHAFADALAHYCQDQEARLAAGRAGIAFAQHYGWDEVNQELVEAYIRTIRQHAKGGLPRTGVP
jgi:glycosyltransferase involved in cell wall biosynthesis